jgi:hypothetical protein
VDPDGSIAEFEFNMLLSFEESAKNYGVRHADMTQFGKWMLAKVKQTNPSLIGVVCSVLDYAGLKFDELDETIMSQNNTDDVALALIGLSRKMNSALATTSKVLSEIY